MTTAESTTLAAWLMANLGEVARAQLEREQAAEDAKEAAAAEVEE